jgi:hypothetical protein
MSESCTWTEDDDGVWDTACGQRFETVDGTPHENDMLFCCYCGRPLVEQRQACDRGPVDRGGSDCGQA